jgi:uncharacterized protein YdeI (YjbR/CyaY-like superfamily)
LTPARRSDVLGETLEFRSGEEWEGWLARNHARSGGVWMRIYKKGSRVRSIGISEAVDVALCYGWISGQSRGHDERSWLGRFVPRRPGSIWSKINTERAERLIREGRMKPAGFREVEEAKRDGRWERAYPPPSRARLPGDLAEALAKSPKANAFFETLDRANFYAAVFRLETTRDPATRKAKVSRMIKMFENGEKFH